MSQAAPADLRTPPTPLVPLPTDFGIISMDTDPVQVSRDSQCDSVFRHSGYCIFVGLGR